MQKPRMRVDVCDGAHYRIHEMNFSPMKRTKRKFSMGINKILFLLYIDLFWPGIVWSLSAEAAVYVDHVHPPHQAPFVGTFGRYNTSAWCLYCNNDRGQRRVSPTVSIPPVSSAEGSGGTRPYCMRALCADKGCQTAARGALPGRWWAKMEECSAAI